MLLLNWNLGICHHQSQQVSIDAQQTKPNQTKPNQTKPNQTKPNQTKPNHKKVRTK
jgi:hypothetical protein